MNVMMKPASSELVLTRELTAPRERVFAAWIDVKQASLWWVPRDFMPLSCEMDVRPGGIWRRRMRSPSGDVILKHGVYREVAAPERLVDRAWVDASADLALELDEIFSQEFLCQHPLEPIVEALDVGRGRVERR